MLPFSPVLCAVFSIVFLIGGVALQATAATFGEFRLHRFGHAVEINFEFRGSAPQWHLSGHGQELWLDLDRARTSEPARRFHAAALFPLVDLSSVELRPGRVRVVMRVSGKIDYAVAQNDHELAVRVAPSGQYPELAQSLLAEMDQTGQPSHFQPAPVMSGESVQSTPARPLASGKPRDSFVPRTNETFVAKPMRSAITPEIATVRISQPRTGASFALIPEPVTTSSIVVTPTRRPIVVIDAGHGGFDPGTESAGGVAEKTLALAIARRVETALQARGLDAELTRADDSFLGLSERTEFANHAHAALFVSIHLNSGPDRSTSGIETYYLNNTTDRATIRLARLENGIADYSRPASNLNYILTNLRQDYKANESAWLARMIEAETTANIATSLGLRVNALGAKMGPFYVLVGAEMPSVLIECGFLSNSQEAELLMQPQYQQGLADGIANAVLRYFSTESAVGNL